MRIKGHGVRICSNLRGAVPNLYTLEKVRPVYHYSSKIHRRLAYLNWIILDSTCLFPTGNGTSDPSAQLNDTQLQRADYGFNRPQISDGTVRPTS